MTKKTTATLLSNLSVRASAADRVMACPLSAHLEAQLTPDQLPPISEYAEEGQDAHKAAATRLKRQLRGKGYASLPSELDEPVSVYCDYVLRRVAELDATRVLIEKKVDSPSKLVASSTPDCVILGADALEVVDYKHGEGVLVGANSDQLKVYLLLLSHQLPHYDRFYATIIQPRHYSYEIPKVSSYTRADLIEFGRVLLGSVYNAMEDKPNSRMGEHCRFCPALLYCPRHLENLEIITKLLEEYDMKPENMPDDRIAFLYDAINSLSLYKKAVNEEFLRRLANREDKQIGRHYLEPAKMINDWSSDASFKLAEWCKENGRNFADMCQPTKLAGVEKVKKVMRGNKKKLDEDDIFMLSEIYSPLKPRKPTIKTLKETDDDTETT